MSFGNVNNIIIVNIASDILLAIAITTFIILNIIAPDQIMQSIAYFYLISTAALLIRYMFTSNDSGGTYIEDNFFQILLLNLLGTAILIALQLSFNKVSMTIQTLLLVATIVLSVVTPGYYLISSRIIYFKHIVRYNEPS
jgi:hypothetical protein